jgi:hypothetical protein
MVGFLQIKTLFLNGDPTSNWQSLKVAFTELYLHIIPLNLMRLDKFSFLKREC